MPTVRVLVLSCAALILIVTGSSEGRIVYFRLPQQAQQNSYNSNANYARRGGSSSGGGHGHGHATSYQNFVLHSYHPVKVYLKPHHHHYDYN